MNFNEYQDGTLTTWNRALSLEEQIHYAGFGLTGESGEVAELIKKDSFQDQPYTTEQITKELGDVLYNVAVMAALHGLTLETIAGVNAKKLKARYPNGWTAGGGIRTGEGK